MVDDGADGIAGALRDAIPFGELANRILRDVVKRHHTKSSAIHFAG